MATHIAYYDEENRPVVIGKPESEPPVRSSELVGLLASGLEAAEGAQVVIEAKFANEDRDPHNNDNYCRLIDWMKDVRRALGKQPNAGTQRRRADEATNTTETRTRRSLE